MHTGDAYRQTLTAFEKALSAAAALGAERADVIRTRILLAPASSWEDAIRAHRELFEGIAPANTTFFVAGFIPDVLVEVELDAIIDPTQADGENPLRLITGLTDTDLPAAGAAEPQPRTQLAAIDDSCRQDR